MTSKRKPRTSRDAAILWRKRFPWALDPDAYAIPGYRVAEGYVQAFIAGALWRGRK